MTSFALAHVILPGRGATDALLAQIAHRLQAQGVALAGPVQSNLDRPGRRHCDMDLRIPPDGPTLRISEDRGDLARGCRLDSGVLEQAVVEVQTRLAGAALLMINKFGKREAEGHGLVPVIAQALDAGLPVLVGVNALNLAAFDAFAGGLSQPLPPDPDGILAWCLAHASAVSPLIAPG
jgi:hypothetical protein